ncbi:MAG: hypothetical protein RIR69_1473, partial [Actinomycetota bacterium]
MKDLAEWFTLCWLEVGTDCVGDGEEAALGN